MVIFTRFSKAFLSCLFYCILYVNTYGGNFSENLNEVYKKAEVRWDLMERRFIMMKQTL